MLIIFPTVFAVGTVLLFRFINKKYNPPIFGVYKRRNKYFWFKFVFMYIFLRIKQLIEHLKWLLAVELGYSYDGTVHIHERDVALEQKYALGEDQPLAVDAVYFNGMSKKGALVICGIARRPEQVCDAFLYLKVDGEDLLLSPDLPDTYLKQTAEEDGEYSVQGMTLVDFIPMRSWKVSYNGELKSKNNTEKRVVQMNLTWSANWPPYNYDTQMSPLSMAKDLAREQWSYDYFQLLQKYHQTHYEQMGFLEGSVFVDGKEHVLNMPCMRDHSFGKYREWRNFHRYVYHFIYLENGDCMAIGNVSQPLILSHLTIGYLCRKSDQAVLPVTSCDFQLWQHGENQILPRDYGFVFTAGRETYHVQVRVNEEDTFYIGEGRISKFYERWSSIEVNGIRGWACVEWQFNNVAAGAINTGKNKLPTQNHADS